MQDAQSEKKTRIYLIDELRGIVLLSMIAFHTVYDIHYIYDAGFDWFGGSLQLIWQYSIGWVFVFIAGMSTQFSRHAVKRFVKLLIVAVLISLVTYLAGIDQMVKFGVIHLLAACALFYLIFESFLKKAPLLPAAICTFIIFLIVLPIPQGYIQVLPGVQITLPQALYMHDIFAAFGFPSPSYVDADYYPFIPYIFLYLSGMYTCLYAKKHGFPEFSKYQHAKFLSTIGSHTLPIYLLHQPIILGTIELIRYFT